MASITVQLPKNLKSFVDECVAEGAHRSASSYIAKLLKAAQRKRRAEATLLRLVRQADESGPDEEWTEADWKSIEREVLETPAPAKRRKPRRV
jgi:antitoxin ParD1/3/4